MIHMYRYMIGDVICGGCVLASCEDEAKKKLRPHYEEECAENQTITVWIDNDISPDIIQVYP